MRYAALLLLLLVISSPAVAGWVRVGGNSKVAVYADPATGSYFHFILGQQPGIGHLDGLLSMRDSLFVADLVPGGSLSAGLNAGVIYQIKPNPCS